MKYANEILVLWYMACCTWIVAVNTGAHVAFIGLNAGIFALYKWMQEREAKRHGFTNQQTAGE